MKFAFFVGCTIPARLKQYETSARSILKKFDVELVDIPEFNCCGYPLRNYDYNSFFLSSARNIALAMKQDLNIITLCKCCYGSLKKAEHLIKEDATVIKDIRDLLKKEGLALDGDIEIKHLLSVLYHDVGIESLKEKITRPYKDIKIATHYGCHALRPGDIVQFDDPENPKLFDELVQATGAESIYWSSRLECCGAPLLGVNDELSMDIMEKKIVNGKEGGADYFCVSCPYCHLQFDNAQKRLISERGANGNIGSILYTQLLGLTMGIDSGDLQLDMNELDISGVEKYL